MAFDFDLSGKVMPLVNQIPYVFYKADLYYNKIRLCLDKHSFPC